MSYDEDYEYALELHKRLNGDYNSHISISDDECVDIKKPLLKPTSEYRIKRSNPRSNLDEEYLNRTQNLVHPQWETLDPTPDIRALFGQFDGKFFQNRLKCVTLEWSKKMYSCAGICYSRRNRFGMEVTIRLSEPLLKLRSRKDLVETMLHEMIHAYCFVLNIREGNGGHGPQFKKIMQAINKVAGTNITVYHTFHDEVNVYKQHWWRCNGVCQDRSPFFGYVKRTSNRAPGPNDIWWAKHQHECGGTFMKIREPEKTKGGLKQKSTKENKNDLRKYFTPATAKPKNTNFIDNSNRKSVKDAGGSTKNNGGSTLLLNPRVKTLSNSVGSFFNTSSINKAFPPSSYPGLSTNPTGTLRNVVGITHLTKDRVSTNINNLNSNKTNWGKGNVLNNNGVWDNAISSTSDIAVQNHNKDKDEGDPVDRQRLREIWSKRFEKKDAVDSSENDVKRPRLSDSLLSDDLNVSEHNLEQHNEVVTSPSKNENDWFIVDDDVMLKDQHDDIISLSSGESDNSDGEVDVPIKPTIHKNMTMNERQNVIKKEIMDESVDLGDSDIELIDDEYDDQLDTNIENDDPHLTAAIELADTSIIDEFFGEDTLLKEFHEENDIIASGSRYAVNPNNDIITCPICQSKMARSVFSEHLNGCTGIAIKIKPPKHALKKITAIKESPEKKPSTAGVSPQKAKDILRRAGYSEKIIDRVVTLNTDTQNNNNLSDCNEDDSASSWHNISSESNSTEVDEDNNILNSRRYRQRSFYKTTRQCPICAVEMEETELIGHIKRCKRKSKKETATTISRKYNT